MQHTNSGIMFTAVSRASACPWFHFSLSRELPTVPNVVLVQPISCFNYSVFPVWYKSPNIPCSDKQSILHVIKGAFTLCNRLLYILRWAFIRAFLQLEVESLYIVIGTSRCRRMDDRCVQSISLSMVSLLPIPRTSDSPKCRTSTAHFICTMQHTNSGIISFVDRNGWL